LPAELTVTNPIAPSLRSLTRLLLYAACLIVASSAGCDGPVDPPHTGAAGGGGGSNRFEDSECGTCIADACREGVADCSSEPECANYLSCVNDCEVLEDGTPDQQCEAACGEPVGSAAKTALSAYAECRSVGEGTSCAGCGAEQELHPLLTQACGPSASPSLCGACIDEYCCESFGSCIVNNPACTALLNCIGQCNGDPCIEGCYDTHVDALEDFLAVGTCTSYHCAGACAGAALAPCQQCQLDGCPNTYVLCSADPGCFQLQRCLAICNDPACEDQCRAAAPADTVALLDALLECARQECQLVCN